MRLQLFDLSTSNFLTLQLLNSSTLLLFNSSTPRLFNSLRLLALETRSETPFHRQRARRHIVGAAEGRKEIVGASLLVMLTADKRRLHLCLSPLKRLSSPTETSKRLRGAMRGGLWSSFSVPGAGIVTYLDLYSFAGQRRLGTDPIVGVANTPPQESPAWNC